MTFSVKISEQADLDLRNIFEYISFDLQSAEIAVAQIERLEEGIKSLSNMPERFRIYENEPWFSRGLRVMPVNNYLVFYIVNHESKTVTVIRVMYSGRDIDSHLNH